MRSAILQISLLTLATAASAQSLDPTPGTTPPIELDGSIGPGGDVPFESGTGTWKIGDELGEYRGNSLFHSFGRFDVPGGQSAEFSAAHGTPERVLARVTWGERSDIEGAIRSTIPGADLYLVNPGGVRIAGDAQLSVDGSFHVSSAGRIDFEHGTWDTASAAPLPLLDFGDPTGYGFLPSGGAAIEFGLLEQGPLEVPEGETLAAVGGNVRIRGGGRPTFESPKSTIALVAAGPGVTVPIPLADFDPSKVPVGTPLGSVDIGVGSTIFVSPPVSGSLVVRAGDFELSESSFVLGLNASAESTPFQRTVDIAVRDRIRITGGSAIRAGTTSAGRGGDVWLSGNAVQVSNSEVLVITTRAGEGSNLFVRADSLQVSDDGRIATQARSSGMGGAIDIRLRGDLELGRIDLDGDPRTAGGGIFSETIGAGRGGDISVDASRITASDAGFSADGTAIASSTTSALGVEAGNVSVVAETISLIEGAQIFSSTSGSGSTGAVRVVADSIELRGIELDPADPARSRASLIETRALPGSTGSAGELQPDGSLLGVSIDTSSLHVADGAEIGTATQSRVGTAGDLLVSAADSVRLEGGPSGPSTLQSRATAAIGDPAVGPGGLVRVITSDLVLRNGGQITSATTGTGNAGAIEIHADDVDIAGSTGFNESGVFAQSLAFGLANGGDAGSVVIRSAGGVSLREGASVQVTTNNSGNAGKVDITAAGALLVDDSLISASTQWTGDAGGVRIDADRMELRGDDARIRAETTALELQLPPDANGGDAGSVIVTTAGDVLLHDTGGDTGIGGIFVETRNGGAAGTVAIDAGGRVILDNSRITASASEEAEAASGSIDIRAAQGVFLSNDSVIGSRASGAGLAGTIVIDAGPVFEMRDSKVSTESLTLSAEGGGLIDIAATDRIVLTDSEITTSVQVGGGNGGDVLIDPELMVLNRSSIRADADDGNGGRIFIRAGRFIQSSGSEVTAASRGDGDGVDGIVVIDSPDAQLNTERAEPAQEFLDAAGLLKTSCGAAGARGGSFVVSRVAGLPASPEGPLPAPLWSALAASAPAGAGVTPISDGSDAAALRVAARADGCLAREEL